MHFQFVLLRVNYKQIECNAHMRTGYLQKILSSSNILHSSIIVSLVRMRSSSIYVMLQFNFHSIHMLYLVFEINSDYFSHLLCIISLFILFYSCILLKLHISTFIVHLPPPQMPIRLPQLLYNLCSLFFSFPLFSPSVRFRFVFTVQLNRRYCYLVHVHTNC